MKWNFTALLVLLIGLLTFQQPKAQQKQPGKKHQTEVSIQEEMFYLNGKPTYQGRKWKGHKIEGLLFNSRMVQGIFDDLNPKTVSKWAYPDTGKWDPDRNTKEFIAAMPSWRAHGLLAFTINLQGGSPTGYSKDQPWHNSAFTEDGSLRPQYMERLERILDKADELEMVAILGIFYFGQDQRLKDEAAVKKGLDNAIAWVYDHGYRNVIIEVNNECNVRYDHDILKPARVHELIERVKQIKPQAGQARLLVSTSYGGGTIPQANVVKASDFLLLHGNGVSDPKKISEMVQKTRKVKGYRPMPILFNEDDHFDFEKPLNNFTAAVGEYASWGYFDFRMKGEGFNDGYQSVPVNWQIASPRKRAFFKLLSEITGISPDKKAPMESVRIGPDKRSFLLEKSGIKFIPWGFNYDHDEKGDLIEDYWEKDWPRVVQDFEEMKKLGANVVRVHLQVGKFMKTATAPKEKALDRLGQLVQLAEKLGMYLDLTGLGCYHKKDVPPWYDPLTEKERWDVQARFWEAIAKRCAKSPAIFCYDLMNEPVVPGGGPARKDWLGPAFAGKHFVQFITLDTKGRARPEIAQQWIKHLVHAIRKHDKNHLITVGLVDWSLDRPGLTSGFVPEKIAADLDFLCVHLYPKSGKVKEALATLKGFDIGKPVVIEETFLLHCGLADFEKFIDESRETAAGWIGFYWGKTPEEYRKGTTIGDTLMLQWLEFFEKKGKVVPLRQRLNLEETSVPAFHPVGAALSAGF